MLNWYFDACSIKFRSSQMLLLAVANVVVVKENVTRHFGILVTQFLTDKLFYILCTKKTMFGLV
jgi:hypothetical protein